MGVGASLDAVVGGKAFLRRTACGGVNHTKILRKEQHVQMP